jgi:sensor histidine kinase YesM
MDSKALLHTMQRRRWETVAICLAVAGLALPAMLWLLDKLDVILPRPILVLLLILSALLFGAGVIGALVLFLPLRRMTEGWQWPFRSPRKPQLSTEQAHTEVNQSTRLGSTWLEKLAGEQRANLYKFMKTLSHSWIWEGLDTDDPYIETIRELFNGSVLRYHQKVCK